MKLNLKNKISNYGFWVSILSVVFLIVKQILNANGINLDNNIAVDIVTAVCYLLIALGVISNPESGKGYNDIKQDVVQQFENSAEKTKTN